MSLEKNFCDACNRVMKFTKRPNDAEILEIYGLYKQATVGDADVCVESDDVKAQAKWEAWNAVKGLNSAIAKERYVSKVAEIAPKYEK